MNIGRFYNVSQIGNGGMGTVFEGYCNEHGKARKVAIKKFRPEFLAETQIVERFRLEAQTLHKLDHPSIVKIIEPAYDPNNHFYPAFVENDNLYLAMEFVDGDTLSHYVKQNGGPLPERKAVKIMSNILDAMEYVRSQGIIHRDIKPSNIMVRPDGESVCIIDFGIVKDMNSTGGLTTGRCVIGTDGYMSPEQAGGYTVDWRTDIYSLGCVLFFMLTGTHAIETQGSDFETRCAILQGSFPRAKDRNPSLSDHVQSIIDKAVDRNMLHRFQSPQEFKEALCKIGSTVVGTDGDPGSGITLSVGRDPTCDIPVFDPYEKVSRKHMDITYHPATGTFDLHDHSTNGTTVNGQHFKGSVYTICYDLNATDQLPEPAIVLANTQTLSWDEVLKAFRGKVGTRQPWPPQQSGGDPPPPPPPPPEESLGIGYGILSFLIPIVGWALYFRWKDEKPKKAKQAALVAWVGFIVGLIYYVS